jgi:hypothetical protein
MTIPSGGIEASCWTARHSISCPASISASTRALASALYGQLKSP